jgi:hypothetical protein
VASTLTVTTAGLTRSAATVSGTARRLGRPVAVVLPAQLALLKDWSVGLGLAVLLAMAQVPPRVLRELAGR